MESIFAQIFTNKPPKEEDGIYYFGNENDGDCFDKSDFDKWRSGEFARSWKSKRLLENSASRHMLEDMLDSREYVVDLACGPGMGFIPSIRQLSPAFPCLATDANPFVLSEWKKYLDAGEEYDKLNFAQFSIFDIPFKPNSVKAYSSFIGISSSRSGESGYASALSEIRRTLAADGAFYTVENEWADIGAILGLFEKWGRKPWSIFLENQTPWKDRFLNNGFEIVYEKVFEYRSLQADDNELGEAASRYGVDVGLKYTAFIVRKKMEREGR